MSAAYAIERCANPADERASAVRAVVDLAIRVFGWKPALHHASEALGVSPHTIRAIAAGGSSGARIPDDVLFAARVTFARRRAAQLRAELAEIESEMDGSTVDGGGACLRLDRGSRVGLRGVVRTASAPLKEEGPAR